MGGMKVMHRQLKRKSDIFPLNEVLQDYMSDLSRSDNIVQSCSISGVFTLLNPKNSGCVAQVSKIRCITL